MPIFTTPSDSLVDLNEFNRCHSPSGSPEGGEFCSTPDAGGSSGAIRTKAFRAWFGKSKVTDADGKPLVVFHGTPTSFTDFKVPAFFTASSGQAGDYAVSRGDPGAQIVPVYLSIKNPAIVSDDYIEWAGYEKSEADKLIAQGYDGMMNAAKTEIVAFHPEQIKSALSARAFNPKSRKYTEAG